MNSHLLGNRRGERLMLVNILQSDPNITVTYIYLDLIN